MNTKWIMYISENQQWVQMAVLSLIFILLFLVTIEIGLLKRQVKVICRNVKNYLDVILSEEEGSKNQEFEDAVLVPHAEEVKEMRRRSSREEALLSQEKNQKKQQEDAKLLMDVIQEVF